MGREYFHSLLTSPYPIYHKLYADAPALLATVTPADLADFVVVRFITLGDILYLLDFFSNIYNLRSCDETIENN